jgi:hypothetical protein
LMWNRFEISRRSRASCSRVAAMAPLSVPIYSFPIFDFEL